MSRWAPQPPNCIHSDGCSIRNKPYAQSLSLRPNKTEGTMARIRHIAIGTRDPEATARFYIEGLGLKQVGTVNTPTSEGYYLSDGHVNLAILKFKYDDPATTEGAPRYTGLHHFGVEVEDMAEARARIEKGGGVHQPYPGPDE